MTRVVFGSLWACIDGDRRYSDLLEVAIEDGRVVVTVAGTGAAGGMDGGGSSTSALPGYRDDLPADPSPKVILAAVKAAIRNDGFAFKRYGKPTQRFSWRAAGGSRRLGLSLALCTAALKTARRDARDLAGAPVLGGPGPDDDYIDDSEVV